MKIMKSYFATILSLVCYGSLVSQSAAESAYYAKAKEEGRVLIYTSLAASDNKPFRSAFEKANPGVKLEIYRASGTTILQKILTESRAGAHLVDAVLTEGTVLHALKDKNLLDKFDSPERKAFDARFKDTEGYWTDVYPTVHSIPYNTKLVAQQDLPKRYTDLLDPKWKGKLGANRNNFMFTAAMLHLYGKEKGEDFLRKLAQQNPQVRAGGTLTATLVGAGEMPMAFVVYANNVENVKESGSPVDWVRVEEPLYAESHPIAVMARAPHPNAARLLAEFAISKEGQQLISNLGKVPGRSDVQPKIGVDRAKLRMISPEDEAKTAYYQKMFDDLFGKAAK
ncbi:MAG TPA: extracellular solute-binding protein [Candidatus Limnocylindria bacterium]|nr:extracellular solute-binding protein [Candidatus Limnocylindria bacterium]